ncbi:MULTISPECIES: GntR family transcriptional regulator [Plantibacter]|uniref:Transcriptional regulator, GntR family n=1 Tax=Plantibacter cousiniae (nom. nud.) TaxID=199709 RepID=A0ABY1LQT7_9MICO|nr:MULTISPECIES: GntR family transcriptional regulator [Plantibacter]SKC67287.1 transcriptional regulator, GntR family [Plantibacter cousiniae]VXB15283.1 Transcriptional regulator, GntR family [Plantibacter sp. T3]
MSTPTQTTQLYERLRGAILTLDLAPGQPLTERGLEQRFAASRTPVRAALTRLEAEGLARRDGRGWIVAPIDLEEIGLIAEVREALETAGVRLATERATEAQLAAIRTLLDEPRPDDEHTVLRVGGDFHEELATLSANHLLAEGVHGAMVRLARTRWLEVRTPEAREQAATEHRAILDAVAARDPERAADLVARHIRGTNERLIASLTADQRRLRGHGVDIVS